MKNYLHLYYFPSGRWKTLVHVLFGIQGFDKYGRSVRKFGEISFTLFSCLSRFSFIYNEEYHWIRNTTISISPNSWYHQCTSINTETGQIKITTYSCNTLKWHIIIDNQHTAILTLQGNGL